jgi:hypothetical protein
MMEDETLIEKEGEILAIGSVGLFCDCLIFWTYLSLFRAIGIRNE